MSNQCSTQPRDVSKSKDETPAIPLLGQKLCHDAFRRGPSEDLDSSSIRMSPEAVLEGMSVQPKKEKLSEPAKNPSLQGLRPLKATVTPVGPEAQEPDASFRRKTLVGGDSVKNDEGGFRVVGRKGVHGQPRMLTPSVGVTPPPEGPHVVL